MTTFDALQALFAQQMFSAFGLQSGQILQPAAVLAEGDDQRLWAWFDAIPEDGLLYAASGSQFFAAYSAVIDSLIPGRSPFDPIAVAQKKLAAWGSQPPAWSIDDARMRKLLAAAPSVEFPFDNDASPPSGFWGLWADGPTIAGPASLMAAGAIDMTLSCPHLLNFAPQPDDWFLSSALAVAYSNPGKLPWNPDSPITWDATFGPGGTLARFTTNLMIAETLRVRYVSEGGFGAEDQAQIRANVAAGLWPCYLDATAAVTDVDFDEAGAMTVAITGKKSQAVALVATVVSAGQYLGTS